jgi:hypothetical protein
MRALVEPEESDGENENSDSNSLLAGPRNVKPYVAKRGELYMSKASSRSWRPGSAI